MKSNKTLKGIIIAIIIAIASIFVYKSAIAPKLYDKYLNEGIKYLMDEQYEEAILAFDKAIKIEAKSTEARVYQSKAYIGNEEIDKAVEVLEEAQQIDITNEELLKEILEILNEIDSDIAYEFLDRFIEAVGKDNISEEIKDILNSAYEIPSEPIVDPEPGTYVNEISVRLKQDKMKIGHSYYYTIDGSEPNKNSIKYNGKIDILESTTIKLIGYNKNDKTTEVITLEYIIDRNILTEIDDIISQGDRLIKDTNVGTEVGNISKEDKDKLQYVVDKAKDTIKNTVNYDEINELKIEVEEAIKEFENNIIKPTDKSKLKQVIDKAQKLYDSSTEGNKDGQYKSGSRKVLLDAINNAKKIYDDKVAKQNDINNEVISVEKSIKEFENQKIMKLNLEETILGKFIIFSDGYLACQFTSNKIKTGYPSLWYGNWDILDKKIEGNTIQYKCKMMSGDFDEPISYSYSTVSIKVLDSKNISIRFYENEAYENCRLLTPQEFENAGGDLSGWQ